MKDIGTYLVAPGYIFFHLDFFLFTAALFRKDELDFSMRSPQMFFVSFGATRLVATVSFYLLEKPITDLKDRLVRVSS